MSASDDREFTIRVTGAAPPPLPSPAAKKGKRGGRGSKTSKNNAASQQQRRYNLRLRPSSSLDQMRRDVFALFNVPSGSTNSYRMSFLGGFPPKELNQEGKQTVHELGIRPNESLIVKFSLSNNDAAGEQSVDDAAAANSNLKDPPESAGASTGTGRAKRAAAVAATASFADVIAAQDALMKKDSKKSPKKKAAGAASGNMGGLGRVSNKRVVTIGGGNPKKAKMMEGEGHRLSDGKSFAGSSPPKKRGRQSKKQESMFHSQDDVADQLLSSLGGSGGKGGKTRNFLRSAMKGMVAKSYEASRAAVRVMAINTGEYSFEKVKGGSIVDGGGVVLGTAKDHEPRNNSSEDTSQDDLLGRTLYTVSYSKGMEGRGRYEEQAEIIGLAALKAVLESVYDTSKEQEDGAEGEGNKDGRLRPVLIAQLSPRAFWSLVYHCSEAGQNSANLSVEDMLRSTLPQLDWSHLERGGRKRGLSEKARENLRQKRGGTAQPAASNSSQRMEEEEEAEAIDELAESALDAATAKDGDDEHELNERERRARAAMARFGNGSGANPPAAPSPDSLKNDSDADDWTLVTPMEDDIDELIECIMAGACSKEDASDDTYDDDTAKTWASLLLDSVRNWMVLANSDVDHIISNLTGKDCPMPSSDTIETWIEAAQGHALEEIMLEIVDGDQDALAALQDNARSSSPRDLLFWQYAPGMLLDKMSSGSNGSSEQWDKPDLLRWISRAKTALDVCSWLEDYTSQV